MNVIDKKKSQIYSETYTTRKNAILRHDVCHSDRESDYELTYKYELTLIRLELLPVGLNAREHK